MRKTPVRRRLVIFIIFFVPLCFLSLAALYYLFSDERPPPVADLQVVRRSVPAEANGFRFLDLKKDDVPLSDGERDACHAFGTTWDTDIVKSVLERSNAFFPRIDQALAAPDFQAPPFTYGVNVPYLAPCRRLLFLDAGRVGLLFRDGKEREAFEEALKLVRLGSRFQASQGCSLHFHLGSTFKEIGLLMVRELTNETKLASSDLAEIQSALKAAEVDRQAWGDSMRAEFDLVSSALSPGVVAPDEDPDSTWSRRWARYLATYLVQPNRTRRMVAEAYRRILHDRAWDLQNIDFSSICGDPIDPWSVPANLAGNAIYAEFVLTLEKEFIQLYDEDMRVSATRTMVALKRYRRDRGELPDSLEQLVPDYFDVLPVDPFHGKPLAYDKKKRVLRSLGRSLIIREDGKEPRRQFERPEYPFAFREDAPAPSQPADEEPPDPADEE